MRVEKLASELDVLSEVPGGVPLLRQFIVQLAITGFLGNAGRSRGDIYPSHWRASAAHEVLLTKSGNSKLIKGKLHAEPALGRYPGYSASGQDIWLDTWEHEGTAAVLSAVGARCGKAFLAQGKWSAIANTHIIWIPEDVMLPDFAMLILNNESFWIRSGSAQPFVKVKATLEKHIGIPSLVEQAEIVTQVQRLMALCDQLEETQVKRDSICRAARKSAINAVATSSTPQELDVAWKRISSNWDVVADTPESVEDLRKLFVDLSVRGLLVPYDDSDHSAKALVAECVALARQKRVSHQGFNQQPLFPVPKHWAWSSIVVMCETQTGTTPKVLDSDSQIEMIQYVTAASMKKLRAVENSFVPLSAAKRSGRIAPEQSVLFVGIGATIGKCCLVETQATFNQQIHAATPRNINAQFLTLVLASSYFQKICREKTNATAIPILNKSKWESISIPIPPLSEQAQIVAKTEELFALCDELESRIGLREVVAEKFAKSVTAIQYF